MGSSLRKKDSRHTAWRSRYLLICIIELGISFNSQGTWLLYSCKLVYYQVKSHFFCCEINQIMYTHPSQRTAKLVSLCQELYFPNEVKRFFKIVQGGIQT